jgi:hypothetical protein
MDYINTFDAAKHKVNRDGGACRSPYCRVDLGATVSCCYALPNATHQHSRTLTVAIHFLRRDGDRDFASMGLQAAPRAV